MARRKLSAQLRRALSLLTKREREVLELRVMKGMPYKNLAANLGIAEGTAKLHAARAFDKLGVATTGEAVALLMGFV